MCISISPTLRKSLFVLAAIFWAPVSMTAQSDSGLNDDGRGLMVASLIEDQKRPLLGPMAMKAGPKSSWAVGFDNDILTPMRRDQDYTYGFSFTYTGNKAKQGWYSLHDPLMAVNRSLEVDQHSAPNLISDSVEIGLFGFTPEEISDVEANPDDRPYASLMYLSSVHEQVDIFNKVALKTTLTVGILGVDIVGELQNVLHNQLNGDEARGWNNQISDGGELTARYAVARQHYLGTVWGSTELKSTLQASVGYLTELSWSMSFRSGKYYTPWSSFNPDLTSYGEKSTYTIGGDNTPDRYMWAGIAFKARAYNAFLQGQFRDSAVTYRRGELSFMLVEAWIGYTFAFAEDYRLSYVLRGHSSEIEHGAGDRALVWGGLIVSKTVF